MTEDELLDLGVKLYGPDKKQWKFKCPSCGYVAKVQDWLDHEGGENMIAFSCIGRLTGSKQELGSKEGGPCNYAGGGLFQLNPIEIIREDGSKSKNRFFAFADEVKEDE